MCLESAGTRIGERNVAGFPAVRAVVEAVHAKMHLFLSLADGAVLLAGTESFGFVTLQANNGTACHKCLHKKLYLSGWQRSKEQLALEARDPYLAFQIILRIRAPRPLPEV